MNRLRITIDHLVLEGVSALDRQPTVDALRAELGRLFAAESRRGGLPVLDGGDSPAGRPASFSMPPGLGAEAIGRHVARAIYRSQAGAAFEPGGDV